MSSAVLHVLKFCLFNSLMLVPLISRLRIRSSLKPRSRCIFSICSVFFLWSRRSRSSDSLVFMRFCVALLWPAMRSCSRFCRIWRNRLTDVRYNTEWHVLHVSCLAKCVCFCMAQLVIVLINLTLSALSETCFLSTSIYPAFSWVRPLKLLFICCLVMFSLSWL